MGSKMGLRVFKVLKGVQEGLWGSKYGPRSPMWGARGL